MSPLSSYRKALTRPGAPRVVAALFLCYLSSGMVGLAMLLASQHATGSYAVAGTVVGLYAGALAFGAPIWGRIADVWGPRQALGSAAAVQAAALAGFIVALGTSTPWGLFLAAAIGGAASPPSGAVAKRVFVSGIDPGCQRGLLAITGLFAEVVFVLGPLVVAAVTAIAGAAFAVVAAATSAQLGGGCAARQPCAPCSARTERPTTA